MVAFVDPLTGADDDARRFLDEATNEV